MKVSSAFIIDDESGAIVVAKGRQQKSGDRGLLPWVYEGMDGVRLTNSIGRPPKHRESTLSDIPLHTCGLMISVVATVLSSHPIVPSYEKISSISSRFIFFAFFRLFSFDSSAVMLCGIGGARGALRLFTITVWRNDDAGAEVSDAMSAAAAHVRPR